MRWPSPFRVVLSLLLAALAAGVWLAAGVPRSWGLVVALAVALALAQVLAAPAEEIRRFAQALAAGDLGRRLRWRRRPGAEIARALDEMAGSVGARIAAADTENEQLRAVLAGMVEGVLVLGIDGRIVLANPRLRQMLSLWDEIEGRTPLEVIRNAGVDAALRAAAQKGDLVSVEVAVGGAAERVVLVNAVCFPDTGPRHGTVAVFHDVTELRRLEGLRRDFVANVSHELKTPLTAVRGFAETLLGGDVPNEEVPKYLGIIVKHAERLATLIDDLLELSRIESRRVPLQHAPVDVVRVAAGVVAGMEPLLRSKSLSVRLAEPQAPPIHALGDRRAIEQVLTNLLDNAAKYTNPGGHIEVRVGEAGGCVRTEVRDDGIGIPEEDLPRIFERFYRVDKARSRDLGGTGLGLAIVKHLVQAMDGEVLVESELGCGSVFWFTLPVAPLDQPKRPVM
ncbi:MAG: PAS domain-containing protein [Deltaproteobacteria bacterium]|nr:PAS domain-containing protein [Deltaproteobacteria bacterium]